MQHFITPSGRIVKVGRSVVLGQEERGYMAEVAQLYGRRSAVIWQETDTTLNDLGPWDFAKSVNFQIFQSITGR